MSDGGFKRILLGGAGGAPTNGVIRSLRVGKCNDHLIGMSSVATDLLLADVEERLPVPAAVSDQYPNSLAAIVKSTRPDFLHVQNDFEVRAVSRLRRQILDAGVRLYLPSQETVENTVDKLRSYAIWRGAGVPVPETMVLHTDVDLRAAFSTFGGDLWIRAIEGAGGHGALPVRSETDYDFAKSWITRFQGWGSFTASELLSSESVTWLSIWYEGELVVAQTRARRSWSFGNRTLSGVTGVTGVGVTCSNDLVTKTALAAIESVDARAHGIFGVDMTYDFNGVPQVTEINIGRFFTTIQFFTAAGVNFPQIYRDIAIDTVFPSLSAKINPLPDGLAWIRGMDTAPVLTTVAEIDAVGQFPVLADQAAA